MSKPKATRKRNRRVSVDIETRVPDIGCQVGRPVMTLKIEKQSYCFELHTLTIDGQPMQFFPMGDYLLGETHPSAELQVRGDANVMNDVLENFNRIMARLK